MQSHSLYVETPASRQYPAPAFLRAPPGACAAGPAHATRRHRAAAPPPRGRNHPGYSGAPLPHWRAHWAPHPAGGCGISQGGNYSVLVTNSVLGCTDTSNVATIKLTDTCISLISVTDTLIINAQITNTNLPVKINTLKVFPNPASSQITIDYGNFNEMSGYTLTIVNSLGQSVFSTPINQQTSTIDLSSLSGKGFYFIRVIDPQNNTIENRKLIIE